MPDAERVQGRGRMPQPPAEVDVMAGRDREERGGYISFADRFDGGGPGRSGARFEGGGILSDFANMVATPRKSRGADTGQIRPVARPSVADINAARARVNAPYSLGRDLFDGGGLGRRATLAEINAGRGFRGGLLSNLANMFGVRPMGSNDLSLIASYDAALASRPDIAGQMQRNTRQDGLLANPVEDEGFNTYVEGLGPAADGATQEQLRQGYKDKMSLLDDYASSLQPYGTMAKNQNSAPPLKFSERVYGDIGRPRQYDPKYEPEFMKNNRDALRVTGFEHEMPAGLLGQVQGEAAVIETTAKQLYDNDYYFMSMDQAREVAKDPVALKAYRDGKR